jgi:serine/threonine protein kinase/Tfp pilus assembly protein PilF
MCAARDDVKSIFGKAMALASADARAAYLDRTCGTDRELRAEVDSLLQAHQDAGSFLHERHSGRDAILDQERIAERPGTIIGPYKLLEQIGEGGFGVVFMAEQQEPMRRKVALKVVKPGMDSKQVIARFEAERQALALMDHPNIARVLDGGQSSSGRPYFAMDLVRGLPITEYCDQCQLTPRQRLELFVDVCQAVQHAHQKGIIHRDLKPSNVLVTLQDGRPLVKVIDFGVAKALGQQLTDKTLFTGFAQMLGTPLYMSPEQAALSNVDVDTRSDIYSLGVLLYELLTGTTPFDRKRLQQAAYDEIRRIIREEEPPRPSTRLSTLGPAATALSTQRQSDPKRLSQLFRGELDWIVMKCLEKDRNRRYETANGLARDIERYLHDDPVYACPPSVGYRLRKFARRHKASLTTAALLLAALLLGSGLSIWQAIRATLARDAEVEARLDLAAAKQLADDRAEQIGQDLERLNAANDLIERGRFHVEFYEWAKADSAFTNAAKCRKDHSRVWIERAQLYTELGLWDLAAADFASAFALKEPASTHFWYFHALLRVDGGHMNSYRDLCKGMDARFAAPVHPQTCDEIARTCLLSADPVVDRAKLVQLAERAVAGGRTPWRLTTLATAYLRIGEYEKAVERLHEAQAVDRNWEPIATNAVLAMAHYGLSHTGLAGKCLDAATAARKQRIQAMVQTGPGYLPTHWWNIVESNVHYREAKTLIDGLPPPEEPWEWVIRGRALATLGRDQEAVASFSRALTLEPTLVSAWINRADAWRRLGAWDKSKADYLRAIDIEAKAAWAHNNLAWLLATCPDVRFRDPPAAVAHAKEAVAVNDANGSFWNTLGVAHYRAADWPAAVTALLKSVELRQGGTTVDCLFLAMAHWRLGREDTARRWIAQALQRTETIILANDALRRFRVEAAALLGVPEDAQAVPAPALHNDLELCTLVLETNAGAVWAYHRRATARLELTQWGPAAADLHKAVELNPDDHYRWFLYAQALLLAHDTDGYRKLCTKMLKRFGQTKDRAEAGWLINVCILGPEATADYMPIVKLAEWDAANHPNEWHTLHRLAEAYYRAGRFEAGVEVLQKAGQAHKNGGNSFNWFFLVMAHHRLGHADEAREWLTKATQWMDQAAASNMNDPYVVTPLTLRYRMPLLVLRREAEALVTGPADDPPSTVGKKPIRRTNSE